jgi:hypothetical protein
MLTTLQSSAMRRRTDSLDDQRPPTRQSVTFADSPVLAPLQFSSRSDIAALPAAVRKPKKKTGKKKSKSRS